MWVSVYNSHIYALTLSGGYSIQDTERGNLFMLDTTEINDGVNRAG